DPVLAARQALAGLQRAEAERAVDVEVRAAGRARDGGVLEDRTVLCAVGDQVDAAGGRDARAVGEQLARVRLRHRRRAERGRIGGGEAHAAQVVLDRE